MANIDTPAQEVPSKDWHWRPPVPIETGPLFNWPPQPMTILAWLVRSWLMLGTVTILLAMTLVVWFFFQPAVERCATLELAWIGQIYARNLVLTLLFVGGLHLYFHTFRLQRTHHKFEKRELARNNRAFWFGNQVWDNMFWTLGSGVFFWTAWEAGYFWALANGYAPALTFTGSAIWFIAMFPIVLVWNSAHFYFVHRWMHEPRIYPIVHALHHRNINTGPWTGISMHPLEHAPYFSTIAIHFILPSHPIHVIFHMLIQGLSPAPSHSGYEGVWLKDRKVLATGDFFHQLHHRFFECNYGTYLMPWDRWFGTFHDGTDAATETVRERRRQMFGTQQ